jgi:hypothetical protein
MYSFFSKELTQDERIALAEAGQTAEPIKEAVAVH